MYRGEIAKELQCGRRRRLTRALLVDQRRIEDGRSGHRHGAVGLMSAISNAFTGDTPWARALDFLLRYGGLLIDRGRWYRTSPS